MPSTLNREPQPNEPPTLARLARSIVDFLLYSREQGFSLHAKALRERAKAHFCDASDLLASVYDELACDEVPWYEQTPDALAHRILVSDCFTDLRTPIDEDELWYLDDEALASLNADRASYLFSLSTMPPWQPPSAAAHHWLHAARDFKPMLANVSDIANWLSISREEWDCAMNACNYRLRVHRKTNGKFRLLEIPPESKRVLQRRLLHRLLDRVVPHEAAHGFVATRSAHTHARMHTNKRMVIRLDLSDFFANTSAARVFLLFRALGLDAHVANALTALCTTSQTRATLRGALGANYLREKFYEIYSVNHLPQGAPTSPALANLCAHSLDVRLTALAREFGAIFTRYADDLVFSGDGDIAARPQNFVSRAREIIADEGWQMNPDKTRIMRYTGRQSFTGLVVNQRVNVARDEYDCIKAAVHQATRDDVPRVLGLLAWLQQSSPQRAEKLRAKLFRTADRTEQLQ
jgi:Reverse transcriptase (RNA-dependent DNA polymerase)